MLVVHLRVRRDQCWELDQGAGRQPMLQLLAGLSARSPTSPGGLPGVFMISREQRKITLTGRIVVDGKAEEFVAGQLGECANESGGCGFARSQLASC